MIGCIESMHGRAILAVKEMGKELEEGGYL
jgi:hypothetical protein